MAMVTCGLCMPLDARRLLGELGVPICWYTPLQSRAVSEVVLNALRPLFPFKGFSCSLECLLNTTKTTLETALYKVCAHKVTVHINPLEGDEKGQANHRPSSPLWWNHTGPVVRIDVQLHGRSMQAHTASSSLHLDKMET